MPVRIQTRIPRPDDEKALVQELIPLFQDQPGEWFVSIIAPVENSDWHVRIEGPNSFVWSQKFPDPNEVGPGFIAAAIRDRIAPARLAIRKLVIDGFGPFQRTNFELGSLEVLVGANGSGKTTLFELLRAIREFSRTEVPPEIIPGWETREVFHRPGPDRLLWRLIFRGDKSEYFFGADIIGPVGNPSIAFERITASHDDAREKPTAQVERRREGGWLYDGDTDETEIRNVRSNQLAFRSYVSPNHQTLFRLKEQLDSWRFFSGIRFNDRQLRQPALIEEAPRLRDDGGNLASVLHWLQSDHSTIFNEIELHIRGIIPAFRALGVRSSGAGRVTLTWEETGLVNPLSAADLSDGSLRLLLWLTLSLTPNPPSLVCIDEPEVGMHPRTMPVIAALLKKLSERTQVLITTHSSYLLAQFEIGDVAVLRKRDGAVEFSKPATSAALVETLREYGSEELELMHRSDELEALT